MMEFGMLQSMDQAPGAVFWLGIQASMLLLTAGAATLLLRKFSAAGRHVVWAVALTGVLALPVVSSFSPLEFALSQAFPAMQSLVAEAQTVEAPTEPNSGSGAPSLGFSGSAKDGGVADAGVAHAEVAGVEVAPVDVAPVSAVTPMSQNPPGASRKLPSWSLASVLTSIWALGFAVLALQFVAGAAFLTWLARSGTPAAPRLQAIARDVQRRTGVTRSIGVTVHHRVTGPMTWGVLRPVLLFPPSANEWADARLQVVLTHELAHVARMDVASRGMAALIRAVHWFNPLVWWATARMTAEAEQACDDCVIRSGARPSEYADHLLALAADVQGTWALCVAGSPMAQRSGFEGRILSILRGAPGDRLGAGIGGLVIAMGAGMALLVGSVVPVAAVPVDAVPGSAVPTVSSSTSENAATPLELGVKAEPEAIASPMSPELPATPTEPGARTQPPVEPIASPRSVAVPQTAAILDRMITALSDTDAEVRVSIVQALANQEDPRAIAALSRALATDTDAGVRESAAWALGRFEDAVAVPALVEALRDDESAGVRRTSAWALGQIEDERGVPGLGEALSDSDKEVRESAVWALGQIESTAAIPFLRDAISDEDQQVRMNVVWALGQIEDQASVPVLVSVLSDTEAEVRSGAVWALGKIDSESAVEPLIAVLADADEGVRRNAVWALGQIDSPSSVPALARALGDEDAKVRSGAAWALGQIEPATAPTELTAALADQDEDVRRSAAWALSRIEDPASVPALTGMLRDPDANTRLAALSALGSIRSEASMEAIVSLLEDANPEVRRGAARALAGKARWSGPRPRPRPRPSPRPRPRPRGFGGAF